ncbi:O-unit flippase-like protein [Vibrio diazotrophicus]|uniref:O-unit flippase-like protein n=1 Tax=Vibrio diazotrophicus TaxID=685 RepID=UPI0011AFBC47|nr:O-unit flippase-like protein [Vibrio diazotrophicus]
MSRKDIIWGYFSQFLFIGSGVIIIPLAAKYLSSEEMGLWYLFVALAGLAQLLEFGFQLTISRMTSYVYSGALDILPEGVPNKAEGQLDVQLLYDLFKAAKKVYLIIAIGAVVLLTIFATIYLSTYEEFGTKQFYAWLIFSISTVVNLYFTYFNGLIVGRGDQHKFYKAQSISKLTMLAASVPLLILDFGLLSMSFATFVSMLVFRILLNFIFFDKKRREIYDFKNIKSVNKDYSNILWLAAWKLGITSIGAYLIRNANIFIASSFIGLNASASYGLTMQLLGILASVSGMVFNLNLPKLTSLQTYGAKKQIKEIFTKSIIISHALYMLGGVSIVSIGIPLLDYLHVNTKLVDMDLLILLFIVYQLEMNHSLYATYFTTKNTVPFLNSAIFSGFFIVFLSLIFMKFTNLGLLGLIVSQGIVQLVYNNWYWPLAFYRDINN